MRWEMFVFITAATLRRTTGRSSTTTAQGQKNLTRFAEEILLLIFDTLAEEVPWEKNAITQCRLLCRPLADVSEAALFMYMTIRAEVDLVSPAHPISWMDHLHFARPFSTCLLHHDFDIVQLLPHP
jgi:hypothetical protein